MMKARKTFQAHRIFKPVPRIKLRDRISLSKRAAA